MADRQRVTTVNTTKPMSTTGTPSRTPSTIQPRRRRSSLFLPGAPDAPHHERVDGLKTSALVVIGPRRSLAHASSPRRHSCTQSNGCGILGEWHRWSHLHGSGDRRPVILRWLSRCSVPSGFGFWCPSRSTSNGRLAVKRLSREVLTSGRAGSGIAQSCCGSSFWFLRLRSSSGWSPPVSSETENGTPKHRSGPDGRHRYRSAKTNSLREPQPSRQSPAVTEADGRSYFRSLVALHVTFGAIPLGGSLAIAGAEELGGPILFIGLVGWALAIGLGWLRTARKHRGKPMFGGDSISAEANWWIGWGPISEAAEATGADAERVRRLARAAVMLTVALWLLTFPVAALLT